MSKVKLSEIGTFKNGLNFSARRVLSGCKMIGVPDFGDNYLAKLDRLKEVDEDIVSTDYLLQDNDILFVRSNGNKNLVGRAMLIEKIKEKVTFSGFCIRFRITNNNVNPLYMLYLFKSPLFRKLFSNTQQTSISNLNQEILGNIEVELPAIGQQNRIVKVIHGITRKIENNKRINDNLEQQAKLIYDYWFTQFDFPDENGKPYCSSGGKMVWNEQLKRNIPENWKVAQLKDIFNVSGKPISRDDCQTDAYYTPIDVIPKRTITFAGGLSAAEANSSLQLYEENNILLGAMRVYFHRVCISAQSGITRTTTLVLKPKADEYLGYAYQVLNDDNAILYATQHSSGTQQPYIKWNDVLENYRFTMPSNPKLLYEYSKISEPLITKAKNCARETEQLRKLRDWLLPMLMNGQATISD